MSRSKIAYKNVSISIFVQVLTLLLNFVNRTIFIHYLGNDYLSCEGLLTNVLTLLSFTELGIGSAIVQSLYKPCAEKNYEKISQILTLISKAYNIIAIAITILGGCIFPIVSHLRGDLSITNTDFMIIYFLFLGNTVASYICGYKRSFLIADQQNYVVSLVHQGAIILKTILQAAILILTKNYFLYLIIAIVTTVLNNIVCNAITNKKYPQLISHKQHKLPKDEQKGIFKNIFSIFQYKIGSVVLNGTDNIIISGMLKTTLVGLVSNYNMIITAVQSIMNHAFVSIQATVGNHVVTANKERQYNIFHTLWLMSFWAVGFISIELMVLVSPFVEKVWLSGKYLLSSDTVLMMVLSFYVLMVNSIPSTYRTALGYFVEAKWCPIIAAVINIILSVWFATFWGLTGIFAATVISRLLTFSVIDSYLVLKKHFEKKPIYFFINKTMALILAIGNFMVTQYVSSFITVTNIWTFGAKLIVSALCCNVIFVLFLFRSKYFKNILSHCKALLKRG